MKKKYSIIVAVEKIAIIFIGLFTLCSLQANAQWTQTSGPYASSTVNCLATDGTNLFAGTQNSGIYLSTDFGSNWTLASTGFSIYPFHSLLLNGSNLFAAGDNGLYLSTDNASSWSFIESGGFYSSSAIVENGTTLISASNGGVHRSTNNGATWTTVSSTLLNATLEVSGSNFIAATSTGVYKSTDDGLTWVLVNAAQTTIQALKANGSNLFAGTTSGGVFLSTDNGTTWTAKNTGLTNLSITSFLINGTDLFAGCGAGVFKTSNSGTSWTAVNAGITTTTVNAMALMGANIFIGTVNTGVYLSSNFGVSWGLSNNGLITSDVRALGFNGSNLFAGSNGTGAYITSSSGANWNGVNVGLTNQTVNAIVSSGINTFAGTNGGVFLTTNNGASWSAVNTGLTNTNITSLVMIGTNLFAGTFGGGVFLSTNNGTTWSAVNTGLTNNTITALATSGTNLYAGTNTSGVFLSTNSGTTWTAVNTGIPLNWIYSIASIGSNVFILDGSSNLIYLTTNSGASWTLSNTGISGSVYSLAASGANIFAFGASMNISTNTGASWSPAASGLPAINKYGFAVNGNNLFVGSTGLGVWTRHLDELLCSVNPPVMSSSTFATICSGSSVSIPLTNTGVAANYTWLASDNLQTSGESTTTQSTSTLSNTITNTSNSIATAVTYTVTPTGTVGGCAGAPQTVTVTVNPQPVMTSNSTLTICSGQAVGLSLTSSTSANYSWVAVNNPNITGESTTAQSSATINDVLVNTSLVPQTVVYTITPTTIAGGCAGNPQTLTVTVNPTPTMTSASSASICSGGTVNINLTSSVPSSYVWIATNNPNTTGESTTFQSAGALSNSVINNTIVSQAVTYTITPTAVVGGCAGSQVFTLTVKPSPNMTSAASASICSNGTASIPLTSDIASTYIWNAASDNPNTTGEILSPQATSTLSNTITNNSTIAQIVYYNVTPTSTAGGCSGATQSVAVTVKPIPNMISAASATICSGGTVSIPLFTDVTSSFVWSAADNLNTTGESTTSQSTATLSNTITNSSTAVQNVIYTVTPTATIGGCVGTSQTVTVTVNPTPTMTSGTTATICSGNSVNIPLTSNVPSNYIWSAVNNVNTTGESTSLQFSSILNNSISNNSSVSEDVIYTVTPTSISGSCAGTPQTVTVTVNPEPIIISSTSTTICSGATTNLPFVTNVASTFSWMANDNVNTTGESLTPQSASVLINTISNSSAFIQGVLYNVTPTSTLGCIGGTQTISVLVNPLDNASFSYSSSSYCKSGSNPTAIITGLTGGTFSSTSGLVFANIYSGLIDLGSSSPGSYVVTYTTSSTCSNSSTFNLTITPAPSASFSYSGSPYCSNAVNPLPTFGTGAGAGVFSANPTGMSFVSTATGEINLSASTPGTYIVTNTIAASGGCASDVSSYTITINPLPVVSYSGLSSSYYYNDPAVSLSGLPAGGVFSGTAVSGSSFSPSVSGAGTFPIVYSYTDINGCTNSSSQSTTVLAQPAPPNICEVTVDDMGINNEIYWDHTQYSNVDSFIVYRETGAGYQRIGAVADTALSMFVDTVRYLYFPNTGDPNAGTYRYKIQILDSLGNYSPLSPYHNTIYFNKSFGTFTWNDYQIEGQPIPIAGLITYDLWRDDNSTGAWHQVNSVTGSQETQTDVGWTAALDSTASWRVMTTWTIGCTPTRASINTTRSNIKHSASIVPMGIAQNVLNQAVSVYPNPANDQVTIEISDPKLKNSYVRFYNMMGQVIYQTEIITSNSVINVSSFAKGIYTVGIENNGNKVFKKLIIN
ncbi:MAG: PKD-like domain-containing protein [Bacteroidia bacterium]